MRVGRAARGEAHASGVSCGRREGVNFRPEDVAQERGKTRHVIYTSVYLFPSVVNTHIQDLDDPCAWIKQEMVYHSIMVTS